MLVQSICIIWLNDRPDFGQYRTLHVNYCRGMIHIFLGGNWWFFNILISPRINCEMVLLTREILINDFIFDKLTAHIGDWTTHFILVKFSPQIYWVLNTFSGIKHRLLLTYNVQLRLPRFFWVCWSCLSFHANQIIFPVKNICQATNQKIRGVPKPSKTTLQPFQPARAGKQRMMMDGGRTPQSWSSSIL